MISVGFKAIPCRLVIIFSIFVLTCTNYMLRVNLSVNLVAMVPLTNNTVSPSQVVLNWSVFERAQVLGSFYWGYLVGAFINIIIQEWIGSRLLLISTSFFNSLLTLLSPLAAKHSYLALVVLRTLMGILTGSQFPSYFRLISKWALDHERTKFGSVPMVGTIGTFFAWMTCGPIISRFGWEWGFYVYGIIGLGITVLSYITIYDSPEEHPRISSNELSYIKEGIKDNKIKPKKYPYLQMLTSIPLWAYIAVEFGQGWIIYTILNTAPHYLASALHYSTSATSMLSSLTYLVRCTLSIVFGYLGDYLLNKHFTSLETLRKCGSLASHIVPGCIALCMTIQGLESAFYVILIIMSLGFNAASVLSSNLNPLYLSKNYIGTLYALSTVVSSASGIFIPLVTATFVQGDETNPIVWRPVFYTAAAIYIISAVIFIIFGSMETQKWNHYDEGETIEQTNMTVNKDNSGAA